MPVISGADLSYSPRGRRAKAARKWFAENGPADLQPLPLGYWERETLKAGGPRISWRCTPDRSRNYTMIF